MISFEIFDFDIIALIIVSFTCCLGTYYGAKREIKHLIILFLPLISLHLFLEKIFELVSGKTKIIVWIKKIISLFLKDKQVIEIATLLLFGIICYFLLVFIVFLICRIFRLKNEKLLFSKENKTTRFFGAVLGLIEGYIVSFISLFFLSNIFLINYNRPITKFINVTSSEISKLSEFNEIKNAYDAYDELYYQLNIIFGKECQKIYDDLIKDEKIVFDEKRTKDEILLEYLEKLNINNNYADVKIQNELNKYFKYKDLLTEKMKFDNKDLDEYCLKIENCIKSNSDELLNALRDVMEANDFYGIFNLVEKTKDKKIIIEDKENSFNDFVYQIVLINYPNIKNIDKLTKNNVLVKYYLKGIQ